MNRIEFLEKVSKQTGADAKNVELVFQKFIEIVVNTLRDGEKIFLANFGTFLPKFTKASKRYSAILGREIEIPAKFTVGFSPSSKVAREINVKFIGEEPKIIKPASEREIEKKVSIVSPELEEEKLSEDEKLHKEIPKEELEFSEIEEKISEGLSLSEEILSSLDLQDTSAKQEVKEKPEILETGKTIKKEEVSEMPDTGADKPKYTYGEDLTSRPLGSETYTPSFSSSSSTSPELTRREGSTALWVTLILLLIGIIGMGIYWALSTDVTQVKKESIVETRKETAPPVVVEKRPTKPEQKQIIVAPEEFAQTPSEVELKEKQNLVIEQPITDKGEIKLEEKKPITPPEDTKKETIIPTKPTITEQKIKPIQRKAVKREVVTVPKAKSTGDFYIQVSSTRDERFARSFANDLRNKGYRAFVESANVPGLGLMYRVKVGYYVEETDVEKDYHNLRLLLKREDIYVDRR